jgi:hypothetical protein
LQEIEEEGLGEETKIIQKELDLLLEKFDHQWQKRAKID